MGAGVVQRQRSAADREAVADAGIQALDAVRTCRVRRLDTADQVQIDDVKDARERIARPVGGVAPVHVRPAATIPTNAGAGDAAVGQTVNIGVDDGAIHSRRQVEAGKAAAGAGAGDEVEILTGGRRVAVDQSRLEAASQLDAAAHRDAVVAAAGGGAAQVHFDAAAVGQVAGDAQGASGIGAARAQCACVHQCATAHVDAARARDHACGGIGEAAGLLEGGAGRDVEAAGVVGEAGGGQGARGDVDAAGVVELDGRVDALGARAVPGQRAGVVEIRRATPEISDRIGSGRVDDKNALVVEHRAVEQFHVGIATAQRHRAGVDPVAVHVVAVAADAGGSGSGEAAAAVDAGVVGPVERAIHHQVAAAVETGATTRERKGMGESERHVEVGRTAAIHRRRAGLRDAVATVDIEGAAAHRHTARTGDVRTRVQGDHPARHLERPRIRDRTAGVEGVCPSVEIQRRSGGDVDAAAARPGAVAVEADVLAVDVDRAALVVEVDVTRAATGPADGGPGCAGAGEGAVVDEAGTAAAEAVLDDGTASAGVQALEHEAAVVDEAGAVGEADIGQPGPVAVAAGIVVHQGGAAEQDVEVGAGSRLQLDRPGTGQGAAAAHGALVPGEGANLEGAGLGEVAPGKGQGAGEGGITAAQGEGAAIQGQATGGDEPCHIVVAAEGERGCDRGATVHQGDLPGSGHGALQPVAGGVPVAAGIRVPEDHGGGCRPHLEQVVVAGFLDVVGQGGGYRGRAAEGAAGTHQQEGVTVVGRVAGARGHAQGAAQGSRAGHAEGVVAGPGHAPGQAVEVEVEGAVVDQVAGDGQGAAAGAGAVADVEGAVVGQGIAVSPQVEGTGAAEDAAGVVGEAVVVGVEGRAGRHFEDGAVAVSIRGVEIQVAQGGLHQPGVDECGGIDEQGLAGDAGVDAAVVGDGIGAGVVAEVAVALDADAGVDLQGFVAAAIPGP